VVTVQVLVLLEVRVSGEQSKERAGVISMALIFAFSMTGTSWMTISPVEVTGKLLSTAFMGPPAATMMSKFGATVVPLMTMLKTR
jgi:hypothetical protein